MVKRDQVYVNPAGAMIRAARAALTSRPKALAAVRGAGRANKARAAATRLGAGVMRYRKRKQNIKKTLVRPSQGGLPSFSKFQLTNKPNKYVIAQKRVSAPNYFLQNGANQIVNSEGFQNANFYVWNSTQELFNISSLVPGGGTAYPNAPKRFHLESVVGELLMTNSSLATQYVDIYDIVRKRDQGASGGGSPPTADPLSAWRQGVSDQTSTSPDFTAWQNVMSLPTDSKLFNDWFRVIKRSHVGLQAGSTHRHSVILKPNKIIDTELLQRSNGDLAGYSVYVLVVINGQPASIKDEGGAIVTTATTALDCVYSSRVKYSWVADNTNAWNVRDNLSTLTGEQITQPSLGSFVPNQVV